jgi:hypothetical protein
MNQDWYVEGFKTEHMTVQWEQLTLKPDKYSCRYDMDQKVTGLSPGKSISWLYMMTIQECVVFICIKKNGYNYNHI